MDWEPGSGSHLLLGGNGAGKTSLLEAIYAVATTRSFRTARLAECIRHGADAFHLVGEVEAAARVRLELSHGPEGLGRSVNHSESSLSEHLAVLPVVAWTSADLEVLTGGPRLRRRFLDRVVVGTRPAALDDLGRYRRALGEKRELLAAGRPERASLETWNRVVAEAAARVMLARAVAARRLAAAATAVLEAFGLDLPPVVLTYRPSPAIEVDPRKASAPGPLADRIGERLGAMADGEIRRAMPLAGPHRDDLEVTWGGRPVEQVASSGERKTVSLALVLAQGAVLEARGREPVYLLDDVDAELAPETLAAVWRSIEAKDQIVASSNRPAVWRELPVERRWAVRRGVVEASGEG